MPIIFRVESEDQVGPYHSSSTSIPFEVTDDHPSLTEDGIDNIKWDEKCGFESLDKLFDWFGEHLRDLRHEYNFVVEISVPESLIRYGTKQLVFNDALSNPRTTLHWSYVFYRHQLYKDNKKEES